MPKSIPPASIGPIDLDKFAVQLDARAQSEIARTLGITVLPCRVRRMLEEAIQSYRATASVVTTPAAAIAAIDEVQKSGRRLAKALAQFTNERSAVDDKTFEALNPSACECLAALDRLQWAAGSRKELLRKHPRVSPPHEQLRHFCGWLRLIYCHAAPSDQKTSNARAQMRKFALAVFNAVGLDRADFEIHPERLDELLATDIQ